MADLWFGVWNWMQWPWHLSFRAAFATLLKEYQAAGQLMQTDYGAPFNTEGT
jgi:hypothetical protein